MNKNFLSAQKLSQIGTMLWTRREGELVGHDQFGNQYFRERDPQPGTRSRRWVIYAGKTDATKVPPEWHCWLHHIFDKPIDSNSQFHHSWMQPHKANQTGTLAAYLPPGHTLAVGNGEKASGDYVAWAPDGVS